MIVFLSQISSEGSKLYEEVSASILDLDEDPLIRPAGPVCCDLHAQVTTRELVVSGALSIEMKMECVRCGVFFSTTLAETAFLRVYAIESEQEEVDLTPDLREAVLLKIPSNPVCSIECRGLCPGCGKNLNQVACDCSPPSWGGLEAELNKLDILSRKKEETGHE